MPRTRITSSLETSSAPAPAHLHPAQTPHTQLSRSSLFIGDSRRGAHTPRGDKRSPRKRRRAHTFASLSRSLRPVPLPLPLPPSLWLTEPAPSSQDAGYASIGGSNDGEYESLWEGDGNNLQMDENELRITWNSGFFTRSKNVISLSLDQIVREPPSASLAPRSLMLAKARHENGRFELTHFRAALLPAAQNYIKMVQRSKPVVLLLALLVGIGIPLYVNEVFDPAEAADNWCDRHIHSGA